MTFVASTGFPSGPFCSTFSVNNFRYFHRSSQPLRTPSALNTYRGKGTKIMAVADRRRRGVSRDVEELITAIETYIDHHNDNHKPFIWKPEGLHAPRISWKVMGRILIA